MRMALGATVGVALGVGVAAWVAAGRAEGPVITIAQPTGYVGRAATFEATVDAPGGELTALTAVIEQGDASYPLYALDYALDAETGATVQQVSDRALRIRRIFDRTSHPELTTGPARVVVRATRPVLFGYREASAEAAVDVTVRLDPPRLLPLSTFHYVNHGGSELVVYRATPPDVESGVRVGNREYPGYPAAGAGVEGADESLRVALFALLHDQELTTPIELYARDPAGNEGTATFEVRVFERRFRRTRLTVDDGFLRRVVPSIVARSPDLADETADGSTDPATLLDLYRFINGELRRRNGETLVALAAETSPRWLWQGPFRQLADTAVQSAFADHRTYLYGGAEVDQQVHLGFDLASTANAPVRAANAGRVIFAEYLGIYGQCIVIDHGAGLQSLYAHLSAIDVAVGDAVTQDDAIGLTGQTGLAGGDHLHFAMLLQGRPVTPMEWWDPHWIEDRLLRKLRDAR